MNSELKWETKTVKKRGGSWKSLLAIEEAILDLTLTLESNQRLSFCRERRYNPQTLVFCVAISNYFLLNGLISQTEPIIYCYSGPVQPQ